jgi:predicted phage terminase large subunit-like protein
VTATLTAAEAELDAALGPLRLRYTPHYPHPKQEWFLLLEELEAFFGGAAGPGKSWALLMAALQYADVPGYNAIILRPELQEFYKPKALIPVSTDWLSGAAAWNGTLRQWTFPSTVQGAPGATLSFGYLRSRKDLGHFKGPAYAFVGFDELTEFGDETLYTGMYRVLRDPPVIPGTGGRTVPLRFRAASNPGGPGHSWVKDRMVNPITRADGVVFVPATIADNPSMDYEEYLVSLSHLSAVDRERLIRGDWDVLEEGGMFERGSFRFVDVPLLGVVKSVRYWDLAATEPTPSNPDPDWTVGVRIDWLRDGTFCVADIVRGRWGDATVQTMVRATAEQDGPQVTVVIEQEPGASGKTVVGFYGRHVLPGYMVKAGLTRIHGRPASKVVRAGPWAAAVGNGLVTVRRSQHLSAYVEEHLLFPKEGVHDDTVDASTGAHTWLTRGILAGASVHRAKGRIPTGPTGTLPGRAAGRIETSAALRRRA